MGKIYRTSALWGWDPKRIGRKFEEWVFGTFWPERKEIENVISKEFLVGQLGSRSALELKDRELGVDEEVGE